MPRRWKNSDDNTIYAERAMRKQIEKLRMELIPGYAQKKYRQRKNDSFNQNYKPKNNENESLKK